MFIPCSLINLDLPFRATAVIYDGIIYNVLQNGTKLPLTCCQLAYS